MAPPASSRTRGQSAGILLYRRHDDQLGRHDDQLEVLLVHPGGPFWARRDEGAWSIPKGEYGPDEDPEAAARREFAEELGAPAPPGPAHDLGQIRQKAGKLVQGFALEGDFDAGHIASNTCQVEWPPRSGRMITIPEVDRAEWFSLQEARQKINPAQSELLDRLRERV